MAKDTMQVGGVSSTTGSNGDAPKRKRRSSGPKKMKPFWAAIRVVDDNGNAMAGAKLEVAMIDKNLEKVVDFVDNTPGYTRQKINLPEPKGKPASE